MSYSACMRVLGRTRLSRSTEESTSIERQREIIESWALQHDHEIIGWAEDIDVSGSTDPFETPGLGPWLKPERMDEWDILCSWKMDRLARRTVPLHKLIGWTQEHDKTLVCIADNIDLSTWVGRLIASVIAGVAEGELEAISERSRSSHRKLREVGRWAGGAPFYGYKAVPLETGGWVFEIDPDAHKILKKMVEETLGGKSYLQIATELQDAGIPSPADRARALQGSKTRGTKWSATTVSGILQSKTLLGWSTHQGATVRDADGAPVMKGPPLLDAETFTKLQAVTESRRRDRSPVSRKSPLRGVVHCWDCETPMHFSKASEIDLDGDRYTYFYCPKKCYGLCSGKVTTQMVYDHFLDELGEFEQMEKLIVRPNDNAARIAELTQGIHDLTELLGTLGSSAGMSRVTKQIQSMDAELTRLEEEHTPETAVKWKGTGKTYGEIWEQLDTDGRRDLMVKAGVKAWARPRMPGSRYRRATVDVRFGVPDDLRERLS